MLEGLPQDVPGDLLDRLSTRQGNLTRKLVWQELVMRSALPPTARLVALVLAAHVGEDVRSWSVDYLAERCGLSDKPVRSALKRLEDDLWITRLRVRGRTFDFALRWTEPRYLQPGTAVDMTKRLRYLRPVTGTSTRETSHRLIAPLRAAEIAL